MRQCGMFLRSTKRFKDGKAHHHWSLVENVRVGRRVFQRQALFLGELNDSRQAEWQRAVEAIDEDGRLRQMKLFPDDRIVTLPRHVEPKEDVSILLGRLGLTLPDQPPPKVSSEVAETMQTQV